MNISEKLAAVATDSVELAPFFSSNLYYWMVAVNFLKRRSGLGGDVEIMRDALNEEG